jgi:short-subunit dehydrogenase
MSKFQIEGSSALITGASAGLGREFARQLAGRAGSIVLVARRQDRLEELGEELTKLNPNLNVHIRATDLSHERAVIDLGEWLEHETIEVNLLINNAGLGDLGTFATIELQRVKEMLAVNVTALTLLTRLLLPGMVARKSGSILNVSSSAGFLPLAGFAVYAATKSYVTSFSEAIRAELRGTGVTVTALCPGPVHTEFAETARRSVAGAPKTVPGLSHVSAQEVVRAALAAIEHDRPLVIPGLIMKLGMTLVRLTPMPILRLVSRLTAKRS